MTYTLTETYYLQMYGDSEPQKTTKLVFVDCWNDVPIVRDYIGKLAYLGNEYEKLRKKYWKLCGGKQLELAEEERKEFQAAIWKNQQLEKDVGKLITEFANSQKDATSWKSVYELEKDKTRGLEIQITNKDNKISQKDKTINSLQLKNEKLSENNKKLYSYLGDAWKMVSHLQKDVAELVQQNTNLQQEREKLNEDIIELKVKVKDLTLNETENQLLVYTKWKDWKVEDYEKVKKELETGITPFHNWDWKNLRSDFETIRSKLLNLVIDLIKQNEEKVHTQKELNDALAILNKPTKEMETQTDLTAEQITQMEKDLEYQRNLLYQGSLEIEKLEQEQTKKTTEIEHLKKQLENSKRNEDEEKVWYFFTNENSAFIIHQNEVGLKEQSEYLLMGIAPPSKSGYQGNFDPKKLDEYFVRLVNILRSQINVRIMLLEKTDELTVKNQTLNQLQTKYDMEVKTKAELLGLLNTYRNKLGVVIPLNCFNYSNYSVIELEPNELQTLIDDRVKYSHSCSLVILYSDWINVEEQIPYMKEKFLIQKKKWENVVLDLKGLENKNYIFYLVTETNKLVNKKEVIIKTSVKSIVDKSSIYHLPWTGGSGFCVVSKDFPMDKIIIG